MFENMNLDPRVLKSLQKLNFTKPTPVQEKAIPLVLEGRDVISLAETGSGKTVAYLAPMLHQVLLKADNHVLILAPTRELAVQIGTVIHDLTVGLQNIYSVVLIGGAAMSQQVRGLRARPRFIVATPGRLMDHVRQRTLDLRNITQLVLDEADRMLDMGFAPQVNEIVRCLSKDRQTTMFSATFSREVRTLADTILRAPVEIEVRKGERPPIVIDQKVVEVVGAQKNEKTLELINAAQGSVVVFTRTKSRTDRLHKFLEQYGVKVGRIHGDRSQGQRTKSITDLRSGVIKVLVATDIAARGLDVSCVTDVINFDIPANSDDYIHRIGRTGRAGVAGQSLTLVTVEDRNDWNFIAKRLQLPVLGKFDSGHKPQRHSPKKWPTSRKPQQHGRSQGGQRRDESHSQGQRQDRPQRRDEQRASQGEQRPRFEGRPQRRDEPRSEQGSEQRSEQRRDQPRFDQRTTQGEQRSGEQRPGEQRSGEQRTDRPQQQPYRGQKPSFGSKSRGQSRGPSQSKNW